MDIIINKPGAKTDQVMVHVYGDDCERENALTQTIKRLNKKLMGQGCPFTVSQGNGFVSINK